MPINILKKKVTDTHLQYRAYAVHAGYLRLQTHTHNMVHAQFMLIPKAIDTHSQYGTYTVHADT